MNPDTVRIAAVADLHIRSNQDLSTLASALNAIHEDADVLLLPGDLTEMGRLLEMEALAELLKPIRIPIFAILGNHDRRSVRRAALTKTLRNIGVHLLDGTGAVVKFGNERTIGIAGVTGTGGGFRPGNEEFGRGVRFTRTLTVKSRRESARLRKILKELQADEPDVLVVMSHFAPTPTTLGTEPPLKYWMLGNALLGRTIDDFSPALVVHGHAHLGNETGQTDAGVPVRNVALHVTHGIRLLTLNMEGDIIDVALRPIEGMSHASSVRESDIR